MAGDDLHERDSRDNRPAARRSVSTSPWTPPVLTVSVVVVAAAAIVFGLAPAVEASRSDLVESLKDRSGGGSLAVAATPPAGCRTSRAVDAAPRRRRSCFIRSLQHVRQVDPGFDSAGLVTTTIDLKLHGIFVRGRDAVLESPAACDPATAAHAVGEPDDARVPLDLGIVGTTLGPEGTQSGDGANRATLEYAIVDPDYFQTVRIPILEGRAFTDRDIRGSAPVIILNDVVAHQFWPGACGWPPCRECDWRSV